MFTTNTVPLVQFYKTIIGTIVLLYTLLLGSIDLFHVVFENEGLPRYCSMNITLCYYVNDDLMLAYKHALCLIILAASARSALLITTHSINKVCACVYL